MCNLTENLKSKSRIGYKVAVKKYDKYFSPAMGHEYRTGDVPIITKQKNLIGCFNDKILTRCFKENMVGRTAAFIKKEDAKFLREIIIEQSNDEIVILKVKLSKKLMKGTYHQISWIPYPVIAGKHMEILGEVDDIFTTN